MITYRFFIAVHCIFFLLPYTITHTQDTDSSYKKIQHEAVAQTAPYIRFLKRCESHTVATISRAMNYLSIPIIIAGTIQFFQSSYAHFYYLRSNSHATTDKELILLEARQKDGFRMVLIGLALTVASHYLTKGKDRYLSHNK